jgi:hypothetical protein
MIFNSAALSGLFIGFNHCFVIHIIVILILSATPPSSTPLKTAGGGFLSI